MKSFFITILATLIISSISFASPFLTCDPPPAEDVVTAYDVKEEDNSITTLPIDAVAGALLYDLAMYQLGDHIVWVRAKNNFGESEWVEFQFVKALPGTPTNINFTRDNGVTYVICDPSADVVSYTITIDGVDYVINADENGGLYYDISHLITGEHTMTVTAHSVWGDSVPTNPTIFLNTPPQIPTGLMILE